MKDRRQRHPRAVAHKPNALKNGRGKFCRFFHAFSLPHLCNLSTKYYTKKSQYITAWRMLCTIFIHSLICIRKLNSWIKNVRSHFPWNNLYRYIILRLINEELKKYNFILDLKSTVDNDIRRFISLKKVSLFI